MKSTKALDLFCYQLGCDWGAELIDYKYDNMVIVKYTLYEKYAGRGEKREEIATVKYAEKLGPGGEIPVTGTLLGMLFDAWKDGCVKKYGEKYCREWREWKEG